MISAFGYIRFSGLGQSEGDSVARQSDAIKSFAEKQGYKIIRWFRDDAVSGEIDAGDRQQFAEMLKLIGPETASVILVERADRLARTLMVSELACEEVRQCKARVFCADSGVELTDESDPTRVLIRQVLGALSQWNKNVMIDRLRLARKRKREENGRCEGRRGFAERDDPEESMTLALIISMRQPGHEWTFKAIAAELDRRKIPPPTGGKWWNRASVHFIYAREMRIQRRMVRPKVLLDGII